VSARVTAPALPPRVRRARHLIALLAAAAAAVAVDSFVVGALTGHIAGSFGDFAVYLGAARSMAAGGSPYAQFDPATVVMSGFIYPPFAALVVRPLALLSNHAASAAWMLSMLACALAGGIIVARTALPRSWPATGLAVLAALAFAPATDNYWSGQINPLIFLLLALAYRDYVRGHQTRCGALLGLAAGIKVAPVVLVVLLLRRRWWRGTAAMAAAGALTVGLGAAVLGLGPSITYLTRVLPDLTRATGWVYDQSLGGAVSRLADQSVLHVQPAGALVQVARLIPALLVVGLAGWTTRARTRPSPERGAEYGLGILAMLLAGGLAWYPTFMHLLIPLFAMLGLAAARDRRAERSVLVAAGAVAVTFGLIVPLATVDLTIGGIAAVSQTRFWWPFLQLCSLPCASAVWLAVALARRLRREVAPADSAHRADAPAVRATA
jgi:alpha-1,2-mannosyltransferase